MTLRMSFAVCLPRRTALIVHFNILDSFTANLPAQRSALPVNQATDLLIDKMKSKSRNHYRKIKKILKGKKSK